MGGAIVWLIRLLMKIGGAVAVRQALERALIISKAVCKAQVWDVPDEVLITDITPESLAGSLDFKSVDKDMKGEVKYESFPAPKTGRYKLVTFNQASFPPPGGVSFLDMLFVAALRLKCLPITMANLSEVIAVEKSCDLSTLGLGDNYRLIAPGTVVNRPSSIISLCYPVVSVSKREVNGKKILERTLDLLDITGPYPSGYYYLFRVSNKLFPIWPTMKKLLSFKK